MAGTVYDVMATYAGLDLSGDVPSLQPVLPPHWKGLEFRFTFRGTEFAVSITGEKIQIQGKHMDQEKIKVHLCGEEIELMRDQVSVKTLN
jgi:trehalose/maltose hydrolase-like predicted phosphorylase